MLDRLSEEEEKAYQDEILGIRQQLTKTEVFWRHRSDRISTALPAVDLEAFKIAATLPQECSAFSISVSDEEEQDVEEPWSYRRWLLFIAMGFLWSGSQLPVFLYGGILNFIETDIGGQDRFIWILLAYLIPLCSITPFVGPLSDIFGRKMLALAAAGSMVLGCAINATAHTMNVFIGGMVFVGAGAGVMELVALAVVGESSPTRKRGLYVGCIIITILPYIPSVLYAQLICARSTWRWISLWIGLWNFFGGMLTLFFYCPPERPSLLGLSRWKAVKCIDATGGVTSTAGLTLILMALTWGGDQYSWTDVHVLVPLLLGSALVVFWIVWEVFLVTYPMFPRRLGQKLRVLTLILIITFVSGANYFSVLIFWPEQYFVVYADYNDPVSVGLGSLPIGPCLIGGSIIFSVLVTVLKGKIKLLMVVSTGIMLAGNGAMAAARLDNLPGVYAAVSIACMGIGAVAVPCQVVSTIICPPDLIASVTALTISVRILGGAIGYATYYGVLEIAMTKAAWKEIVPVIAKLGITDPDEYSNIIYAIADNLPNTLQTYPGVNSTENVTALVQAGQVAFSEAYPVVYLVSIAFGGLAFVASWFLPNVDEFMDDSVAVRYESY